jgi:hypothetical protein
MNAYKHSGAFGDLIYSLIVPKFTGGGDFYLHLNQMDWIGSHYYGSPPAEFHKGRLNQKDFEFMQPFMEAQEYISKFDVLDPKTTEISHNLDRFRPAFVGHPCNYLDLYAEIFNLFNQDPGVTRQIKTEGWLTVPKKRFVEDRPIIINRTDRWISPTLPEHYNHWKYNKKWEDHSVFVGLESEYEGFKKATGWVIPWQRTSDMLELAEYIAGARCFIGNQSQAYALAVGLNVPDIRCEYRKDMPIERNECYFPQRGQIEYF